MTKQLFIDIETNDSLDPKTGTIVQLAYIFRKGGKIVKKGNFKGKNIYERFVADLNTFVDRFNKNDKIYFIAYNATFDSEFIREMFKKNKNEFYGAYFYTPTICVMQLASYKCMIKNQRPENFKLASVCRFFNMKVNDERFHDAEYDVEKTKLLYNKLSKWK